MSIILPDFQNRKRKKTPDSIAESLKQGEKVTIAGLGRFEMRARKTKSFTNPKTKVSSQLEPTAIPGFKASGILKSKLGCKD